MLNKEKNLLDRLLDVFKIETQERINAMTSGLLELEKIPDLERQTAIIENIFREAHSLKGAARTVNMAEIEAICQALESIFARLKHEKSQLLPGIFDILYDSLNAITKFMASPQSVNPADIIKKLNSLNDDTFILSSEKKVSPTSEEKSFKKESLTDEYKILPEEQIDIGKNLQIDTIRISRGNLDSLLLQAEEMLAIKLVANQRAIDFQDITDILEDWSKEWLNTYPEIKSLEALFENPGLMDFLDLNQKYYKSLKARLIKIAKASKEDRYFFGVMVDGLLEKMKKITMLPLFSVLEIFPKMVRELSRERNKKVSLVIQGSEIEIDRRILDEMKTPFIHLLRNSIDHGIESPQERAIKNKPLEGTIKINISQFDSNKVEILFSDDGGGIDLNKVKKASLKRGIIPQTQMDRLNDEDILSLIFQSEVSTSPFVTNISGRGLGLAIVREKVEHLGGIISVETSSDKGTSFRIQLPLTLMTFRGVLVRVNDMNFVIPSSNIERVVRVKDVDIKIIDNIKKLILGEEVICLVPLSEVLGLAGKFQKTEKTDFTSFVVLRAGEKRIAFYVDEVLHEQEVLVKSLGKQLARVRNISGATVLGSGKVVAILNVSDLLKSADKIIEEGIKDEFSLVPAFPERKTILVAEDSITLRILFKNILEAVGYDVKTLSDGVDAFVALKEEKFDLLISSVDLPKMSGLELVTMLRREKKLSGLPVILLSGLDDSEEMELGLSVGANACILKSTFQESILVDTVRDLLTKKQEYKQ